MCYNDRCVYQHYYSGECGNPGKYSKFPDAACYIHHCARCHKAEVDGEGALCEECEKEEGE